VQLNCIGSANAKILQRLVLLICAVQVLLLCCDQHFGNPVALCMCT
jgi:hypothetical protein